MNRILRRFTKTDYAAMAGCALTTAATLTYVITDCEKNNKRIRREMLAKEQKRQVDQNRSKSRFGRRFDQRWTDAHKG